MIVYSAILSVIAALVPIVNSKLIDKGLVQQNMLELLRYVCLLGGLQLLDKGFQFLQSKQEIEISNSFGKSIKTRALEHGFRLEPEFIKEQGFYKTISDALYDISNLVSITTNNLMILLVIIFKAIGAVVGLFILDVKLALFIITLIPIKILVNFYMKKWIEKYAYDLMNANKRYNSWFSELLNGVIDIKIWNLEKRKIKESETRIDDINTASKRLSLVNAKNSLIMNAIELGYIYIVYILGGVFICRNQLTIGTLFAFISFASYLLAPINAILDLQIVLKQIEPSAKSIKYYFHLPEENYASKVLPSKKIHTVKFEKVSLIKNNTAILKDISFEIKSGTKVAIMGNNGSGKTTLINLLLRLNKPTSGKIYFDGVDINEINIEEYRKKFSVVSQNIHLFCGSVKENILLNEDNLTLFGADVKYCVDAINNLADGFDTFVGIDGEKLSGGEKQKVALLRALNRQSEILILDEAYSNYDRESEEYFGDFLKENKQFRYYFIISHKNAMLEYADVLIYLADGEILNVKNNCGVD